MSTAQLKYIRMTPRKMMVVANHVRGKDVQSAIDFLTFCKRRAAKPMLKLLKSALANVEKKGNVDQDKLFIKELMVNKAPTMKRWMPRARGIATPVLKRASHVKLVLEEK